MSGPSSSSNDEEHGALSRASTREAHLNRLDALVQWSLRKSAENDTELRRAFNELLAESAAAPPEQRLIMYDACDEREVRAPLGPCFRKRLDARRNTNPKKAEAQLLVCTPFDPSGFNFSKIKNPRERISELELCSGNYELLTNKFPLFPKHMLLVSKQLVPQQMSVAHLAAVTELMQSSSFCAYFNSWCASASVNHFHCHLIDEQPPVTHFPLVPGALVCGVRCPQPLGFPGFCYVFLPSQLHVVGEVVREMQQDNQPHNFLFTPRLIYLFPKPLVRPARSFALYPETVGGPELLGSFTVYQQEDYDALDAAAAEELIRINTAPLPSRCLRRGGGAAADDAAVHESVSTRRVDLPASRSVDQCLLSTIQLGTVPVAAR